MSFKDNDFLFIEYDLINNDTGKLVATTNEEKAKKEEVYKENTHYGKSLFIVGSKQNVKGLNREIKNMNLNEHKKITLGPSEAFGEYEKELKRVMHLSDFRAHDINPYPGMEINIDNTIATIKTINSGRVIVDFNNPLAGKNVIFDVTIVNYFDSNESKIKALIEFNKMKANNINIKENSVEILFKAETDKDNTEYNSKKQFLINTIFKYLNIDKIHITEEYKKQEQDQKKEEEKEAITK